MDGLRACSVDRRSGRGAHNSPARDRSLSLQYSFCWSFTSIGGERVLNGALASNIGHLKNYYPNKTAVRYDKTPGRKTICSRMNLDEMDAARGFTERPTGIELPELIGFGGRQYTLKTVIRRGVYPRLTSGIDLGQVVYQTSNQMPRTNCVSRLKTISSRLGASPSVLPVHGIRIQTAVAVGINHIAASSATELDKCDWVSAHGEKPIGGKANDGW